MLTLQSTQGEVDVMKQLLKTGDCFSRQVLHQLHVPSVCIGLLGIAMSFPSLDLMSGHLLGVSAPHPDSGKGCALSSVLQPPGSGA